MELKQKLKYDKKLDFFETEKGIKLVKDTFQKKLSEKLSLRRVSAPKFLQVGKGLQDDLAGTQKPVSFKAKGISKDVEIVHSLAKWKRYALGKYGFKIGKGLYTDMDAIRKDEDISPIHSFYVDQWDWEKILSSEERTLDKLKETVRLIYEALKETKLVLKKEFSTLSFDLPEKIEFIYSEDLEEEYPELTPKEREYEAAKKYGAYFLIGIGHPLASGVPHDVRAADYDDWSTETIDKKHGLNGDIIVWDHIRGDALELSSMGIRVDEISLLKQLKICDLEERKELEFHKGILEKKLPLTIGGGIGQSRLCMFILEKAHIGEVQVSEWPEEMRAEAKGKGILLL